MLAVVSGQSPRCSHADRALSVEEAAAALSLSLADNGCIAPTESFETLAASNILNLCLNVYEKEVLDELYAKYLNTQL